MGSTSGYQIPEAAVGWIKNRLASLNTRIGEVRSLAQNAFTTAQNAKLAASDAAVDRHHGTAAARTAVYGTPSTLAEHVALANQQPIWFNTTTGWQESYYVATGSAGLTVPGLVVGSASGWYPTGRADTRYVCKADGFQNIGGAGSSALITGFATRRNRGAIGVNGNRLTVPRAGVYEIVAKAYVTGGQFSVSVGFNLGGTVPVTTGAGTLASLLIVTATTGSDEAHQFQGEYPLAAGSEIGMAATTNAIGSGGANLWGDVTAPGDKNWGWGTSYQLTYVGPPLAM